MLPDSNEMMMMMLINHIQVTGYKTVEIRELKYNKMLVKVRHML